MIDYQQAAIEAVKKELDKHYFTFTSDGQSLTCACGSNVEGHMYSELVSAVEPYLRKKWVEGIRTTKPDYTMQCDHEGCDVEVPMISIEHAARIAEGAEE